MKKGAAINMLPLLLTLLEIAFVLLALTLYAGFFPMRLVNAKSG